MGTCQKEWYLKKGSRVELVCGFAEELPNMTEDAKPGHHVCRRLLFFRSQHYLNKFVILQGNEKLLGDCLERIEHTDASLQVCGKTGRIANVIYV